MSNLERDLRLPPMVKHCILAALTREAHYFLHEVLGTGLEESEEAENQITYIKSVMELIRNWPEKEPPHGNL